MTVLFKMIVMFSLLLLSQLGGPPCISEEWEPRHSWPQNVKRATSIRADKPRATAAAAAATTAAEINSEQVMVKSRGCDY